MGLSSCASSEAEERKRGEDAMPVYEYVCKACGHELEALQRFSDAPLEACPACGALRLRKKLSLSAFHLQGGGWYAQGYGDQRGSSSQDDANPAKEKASPTSESQGSKPSKEKAGTDGAGKAAAAKTSAAGKATSSGAGKAAPA